MTVLVLAVCYKSLRIVSGLFLQTDHKFSQAKDVRLQGYAEFCIELGKVMGIYSNDEEIVADYKWLKNTKK